MKVGTDGVLLGAWANVQDAARILDVGTGTGLIAIMMAQRTEAFIDAVEIDAEACSQALENVATCPWKERIKIHHDTFRNFADNTTILYDRVVSNPPYFRKSLKSPVKPRSLARHNENLNYESLLFYTARILKPEGRLAVIVPSDAYTHLANLAYLHGLFPLRLTRVRPKPEKDPSRCLVEFSRHRDQPCVTHELMIKGEEGYEFTGMYQSLTREYYLNF